MAEELHLVNRLHFSHGLCFDNSSFKNREDRGNGKTISVISVFSCSTSALPAVYSTRPQAASFTDRQMRNSFLSSADAFSRRRLVVIQQDPQTSCVVPCGKQSGGPSVATSLT